MLKVCYLGSPNNHYSSLSMAFSSTDISLYNLLSSQNDASCEYTTINRYMSKFNRIHDQIFGTRNASFLDRSGTFLKLAEPDVILAYWGSNIVPDIIAIKNKFPRIKIVLNVLCHPMGTSRRAVFLQNRHLKYASNFIDGYIFSSKVMKDYFSDMNISINNRNHILIPPLLSRNEFPRQHLSPCKNTPNIIYMGRPDWWAGQPSDYLIDKLEEAALSGIHIYHAEGSKAHYSSITNRHLFAPLGLDGLTTFATQFDASLIMYNLDKCTCKDRFDVTIPDRLIASVSAGIPIALPRKGYKACKEFLAGYKAIIEFDTFSDLKQQLDDRSNIASIREVAKTRSNDYYLESHVENLSDFLRLLAYK